VSRTARAGIGVLVLLVLFLLASSYRETAKLNSRLGRAQGAISVKDRQIAALQSVIGSQQDRLDAASAQRGQFVQVILTLSRQLSQAGIAPAAGVMDVPNPQPGPTATPSATATPSPPAGRARPSAASSAPPRRPTPHPTPAPTHAPVVCVPVVGCVGSQP
jgi:hypothetical protein